MKNSKLHKKCINITKLNLQNIDNKNNGKRSNTRYTKRNKTSYTTMKTNEVSGSEKIELKAKLNRGQRTESKLKLLESMKIQIQKQKRVDKKQQKNGKSSRSGGGNR